MTSVATAVRHRVHPAPATALVALGDLACIGIFVVTGEISHGVDPAAAPWYVANAWLAFALGWALVALVGGLYAADAWASPRRVLALTAPAWAGAALVAQALRTTRAFHGGAALTFYLVSVGVGLALLVPWRLAVSRFTTAR